MDEGPSQIPMLNEPIASIAEPGVKVPKEALFGLRQEVADLLGRRSPNFPGAQPVSFARKHLDHDLMEREYVAAGFCLLGDC